MQISITDTFEEVKGMKKVLDLCKAIPKYTHKSNVDLDQLTQMEEANGKVFDKLKIPCSTTWNSQHG